MSGRLLEWLHDAAIRVQLPIVLVTVPLTAALHALGIVPIAAEVAADGGARSPEAAALAAAVVTASLLVVGVAVATLGASLLLRGSLRATVQRIRVATDAIARGEFDHRVAATRSDELGGLAASIDAMAERLERLEQARRRTLACVSHELRTPLTIIRGHAFTLARSEEDERRLERLELVQSEAARLADLITDLLEAASLQAGGVVLDTERRDLRLLAATAASRFDAAAAARGVGLLTELGQRPVPGDVDPGRIDQVLGNLLANATRHATPGTDIVVSVEASVHGGGRIVVENACAPLADDVLADLFDPFVQDRERPGSVGLGLAIVRALVEAHGGSVSIDPECARRGVARFAVELPPVAPASRSDRSAASVRPRRHTRRRVALVEP